MKPVRFLVNFTLIVVLGAMVSTVKLFVFESVLTLPAASAARALTVCAPLVSGTGGVNDHVPPFATVFPTTDPSMKILTVLLAVGPMVSVRAVVAPP